MNSAERTSDASELASRPRRRRYRVEYTVIVKDALYLDFITDSESNELEACRHRARALCADDVVVIIWDALTAREVPVD